MDPLSYSYLAEHPYQNQTWVPSCLPQPPPHPLNIQQQSSNKNSTYMINKMKVEFLTSAEE